MIVGVVATAALGSRDATEYLRTLAAFVALDLPVRVFEVGPGIGALSGDGRDLEPDGEHYLAALRDEGVAIEPGAGLPAALAAARAVLVFADPARAGVPAVLTLRRGRPPTAADVDALVSAGQVRLDGLVGDP
ncbi:MAG: hypothetical protein U1E39_07125 [Planctomycetota bacterium]